jgi:O-antigen/teichoic acid export membrane protein
LVLAQPERLVRPLDSVTSESPNIDTLSEPIDESAFGTFVSGVALTFGTRLMMLAGVFGSGLIVARWLGPEGSGIFAVLNVTVFLALQIGSAGLPSANTFFIARDRTVAGRVSANAIVFGLFVGSFLAAAIFILQWVRPSLFGKVSAQLLLIAVVSIPFQMLTLLGLNILLALDRIRQLNLFDGLSSLCVFLNAIVVLIVLHRGLAMFISLNTAAFILLSLLLVIYLCRVALKRSSRIKPDFNLLKAMLAYGLKFCISILAFTIILRADLLIVNRFRGAAEAGVYGVASQFSFLLLMLPGVIASLLFPRVSASQDQRAEFAVRVTRHTTVIMVIMCLATAAFSPALPFIYGGRFRDATFQLLILVPGIFLMGIESVLVQHFTGTGLPWSIPAFWVVTLIFNVILNLLTVPRFGARAAALNSTLSYALIFLLVAIYFRVKTGRGMADTFLLRGAELQDLLKFKRASLPDASPRTTA